MSQLLSWFLLQSGIPAYLDVEPTKEEIDPRKPRSPLESLRTTKVFPLLKLSLSAITLGDGGVKRSCPAFGVGTISINLTIRVFTLLFRINTLISLLNYEYKGYQIPDR